MARQDVVFRCGHQTSIRMAGNLKHRERQASWMGGNQVCPDCYDAERNARRDEETNAARDRVSDYDLPALMGSEKQISWAERIRAELIGKIEAADVTLLSESDQNIRDVGIQTLITEPRAHWWIEIGREYAEASDLNADLIEVGNAAMEVGLTVLLPEGREPITQIGLAISDTGAIELYTSRYEGEEFRDLVRDQGYRWIEGGLQRSTPGVGRTNDLAASHVSEFLAAGYAVECVADVANAVRSGEFIAEPKRKITLSSDGMAVNFHWPKSDDLYRDLRALPGAAWKNPCVAVPISSASAITRAAEEFGFWMSIEARDAIDRLAVREAA